MALRSVSYFCERWPGTLSLPSQHSWLGRGEVGQGHVGINGIVKHEGRREEEQENFPGEGGSTEERSIWYLERHYTVRGQWQIINRIWLCILYSVFGEVLGKTTLHQVKVLGVKRQIDEVTAFLRYEEWYSCIRRSVLSPCILSIDYHCVVSVTVGWPECLDDAQHINI